MSLHPTLTHTWSFHLVGPTDKALVDRASMVLGRGSIHQSEGARWDVGQKAVPDRNRLAAELKISGPIDLHIFPLGTWLQ